LTDFQSEEFKDFCQEMKFGALVSFLKGVMSFPDKSLSKYIDRIIVSLGLIERRMQFMNE
jgi:hypothetical protein